MLYILCPDKNEESMYNFFIKLNSFYAFHDTRHIIKPNNIMYIIPCQKSM